MRVSRNGNHQKAGRRDRRTPMARALVLGMVTAGLWLHGGLGARSASAAEELTVRATLDAATAEIGDIVTLDLRIVSRVQGSIDLELGKMDGLSILSQSRSESTSISWSGATGQTVTREVGIRYELEVDKAGTLVIEPITARVGQVTGKSAPLTINAGGAKSPAAPAKAGQVAGPDPSEKNLFLRYRVDKDRAVVGEQVLLHLEVYARPGMNFGVDQRTPTPPELDGFWREIVMQPKRFPRREARVNGRTYHAYKLWTVALFPLSAGHHDIEPVRMAFTRNRSIFDAGQRLRRRTRPVKLQIDALPTVGRPRDFVNTNVGQYTLTAKIDSNRVQANKAVLLTVALSGTGNISAAKLPEISNLDGFRVFPPTIEDDIQKGALGIRGTKRAEILLMPTRSGRLEIPSFTMSVYDPEKKSYLTLTTDTLRVVVEGKVAAETSAPATISAIPRSEDKTETLAPIRFGSDFGSKIEPYATAPWSKTWFVGGLAAPWALFLAVWGSDRLRLALGRETPARRRRSTTRRARSRLKEARAAAEDGRLADAYSAFLETVLTLAGERLGANLNGQTTEQIEAALVAHAAPPSLVTPLVEELQTADFARFAPGGLEDRDPEKVLERWEHIFAALEGFEPKGDA